jgi:hypothetical protein
MKKISNKKVEVWKKIKFNLGFDIKNEFHISNLGNVKTYNKQNNGSLLKGSMQEGYRILKLRFYKERDPLVQKKITALVKKLTFLRNDIKKSSNAILKLKKNDPKKQELKKHIAEQEMQLTATRLKYETLNSQENKKRSFEKSLLIHRLVAEYFCKKPLKDQNFVIHLDHNKLNNDSENLRWATSKEVASNSNLNPTVIQARKDRAASRTGVYSKLNYKQVVAIKKKLLKGKSLRELATEYGVSDMQIYRIKIGENWSNVVI